MFFILLNYIKLRELTLTVNNFIIINFNSILFKQNKKIKFYKTY